MLDRLFHPEVQLFIKENERVDISKLLLKGGEISGVPVKDIAEQISGRSKAKRKLPAWHNTDGIVYPAKISMEQCSSEQSANYKASILGGRKMIDLTGGAGVDVHAFSQHFSECKYIEQNAELCEVTSHNLTALGAINVETYCTTAEQYLEANDDHFDLIYLDPARRDETQKKVFRFEDCTPNVITLMFSLLNQAAHVMIKTAPFLDISQALSQLDDVTEIHVVAVNNECKEVLYILSNEVSKGHQITVRTINLFNQKPAQKFSFVFQNESGATINYSLPNNYLYEPNASILKSGGINSVGYRFELEKLHPNSQLFTSKKLIKEFPGRIFQCIDILKYDKKVIKKAIPSGKANITTRNFPHDVAQIRKKTGLKDGGDEYLFATTNLHDEKIILRTNKLDNPMS